MDSFFEVYISLEDEEQIDVHSICSILECLLEHFSQKTQEASKNSSLSYSRQSRPAGPLLN